MNIRNTNFLEEQINELGSELRSIGILNSEDNNKNKSRKRWWF